jgi:hypothetical protein
MFCTIDSFKAPYQIPNLDQVVNTFTDWLETAEENVLRELMGNILYNEFIAGLEALPDEYSATASYDTGDQVTSGVNVWESLVDTNTGQALIEGSNWTLVEVNKWLELKLGTYYGIDNIYKWAGMEKMLTPYLYSKWLEENFDTFTGIGITIPSAENAIVISPLSRICKAFNDYARIAGSWMAKENTMYGFVKYNDFAYQNFTYTYQGYRNEYGL